MVSVGGGKSNSSETSGSSSQAPQWAQDAGASLARRLSMTGSGNDPGGNIGRIWQNLFGDNPRADYLGARERLQSILSGSAMGDALGQAQKFMEPNIQRLIELTNMGLTQGAGRTGTRFGSDLMNQQRAAGENISLGALPQIGQMAGQMVGQQLGASQGVYDLIAQLGEQNLARQLPLLVSLLTGISPSSSSFGQGSSRSWNANVGVGKIG